MDSLDFKLIELSDRKRCAPYLGKYGEGSCQHSVASMYCLAGKYGDAVCLRDGWLYTKRTALCTDKENVYLIPLGDTKDAEGFCFAVTQIFADAHENGKKVRFETLTPNAKGLLDKYFPERFSIEMLRDYAEYIYTYDKLAHLPGHELKKRRNDLNNFYRNYEGRYRIRLIEPGDVDTVRAFQERWLRIQLDNGRDTALVRENEAIMRALSAFEELELSGIMIYVDDNLAGYTIGAALSDEYFDAMFEKGDRTIPHIYRVLNTETVRQCCGDHKYINREEDVGDMGLRKSKLAYRPDILMMKYRAVER